MSAVSPSLVRDFVATLPREYARRFEWPTIQEHVAVAGARVDGRAGVGRFLSGQSAGTGLCVVAEDRPGLLATISAAMVASDLNIIDAQAYTRRLPGDGAEAVDLFWVQRALPKAGPERLSDEEIAEFGRALNVLLDEQAQGRPPSLLSERPGAALPQETVVRFLEDNQGTLSTLEVETDDRSGLLMALSQALFEHRVQIESSQVRTTGHRVLDRFGVLEFDGSRIGPERRLEIQVAILSAIGSKSLRLKSWHK
jgi:[protein-PII] uridylyltransferase